MNAGVRLGSAFGAPIVAEASAFVLGVVFAVAVLVDLANAGLGSPDANWVVALAAGAAVLGSVLVHELSHVVAAVRRGLHVRAIRLYLFGGYSVIDGRPSPRTEIVVSVVGPAVSIVLGGLVWAIAGFVGVDQPIGRALSAVGLANGAIGVFNLLPGFPLDGGRVLRGLLAGRSGDRVAATRTVARVGQWIGYAAIGGGIVMLVRRSPVGLVVLVTGWFLITTAVTAGRREILSAAFDGMTVGDAMRATPDAVSGNWTISSVLDRYAIGPRLRSLPVEMDGRVVGVVGQDEIDTVAPSRWPSMRVRQLMTEIGPPDVVDAAEPLESLLTRPAGRSGRVVVTDDGVVTGIIEGEDLGRVLPGQPSGPR